MKPPKFAIGDPVVTAGGYLGVVRLLLPGGFVAVKHVNSGPITLERESTVKDWLPAVEEPGLSVVVFDTRGAGGASYSDIRYFS